MINLNNLKAQHDSIKKELDEAISRVISNSSFIMGEEVKSFEENFARYCEKSVCIGTSSGSTALFAVLKCLGIKEGDEVIMPVNTFIATAFAVTLTGAKPVFVDVNKNDALINTELIESKITERTKAIIPVHLYGNVCDMDKIKEIAEKNNLFILEDCAQAHGAEQKGKKVPICGAGCFSFFPAKILGGLGDGGAIVFEDKTLAEKCRKFVNHGRENKYLHDSEGFNFRLDGLQAAILNVKLKYLKNWISKRKEISVKYSNNLTEPTLNQVNHKSINPSYYMYVLLSERRDELKNYLKENGIETVVHYPIPLHLQPALSYLGYKEGDFPIAEELSKEILSIPLYPELTEEEVNKVIKEIKSFN